MVEPQAVEAVGFVELIPEGPTPSTEIIPSCGHVKEVTDNTRVRAGLGAAALREPRERTRRTGLGWGPWRPQGRGQGGRAWTLP